MADNLNWGIKSSTEQKPAAGAQGPPGPAGPPGPQGPPGQSITYTHTQITPAAIWTIKHNLEKYPSVTVVDSAGSVVLGAVKYISENEIEITFSAAFSGKVYLN